MPVEVTRCSRLWRHDRCRVAGVCVALVLMTCAKRIPLPQHLRVSGIAELRQRMERARSPVQKYFAEARITYFGAEGRVKVSASLAVMRPRSLRYDLIGPHGGVVEAFATDGTLLQLLIPGDGRLIEGPATAENVDRMTALAPLRLDPEGWVALLFGELDVPPAARLRYDDGSGQFVIEWSAGGSDVTVDVDPATSRITNARVQRAPELDSTVAIEKRDPRGLPIGLRMKAHVAGTDDSDMRVTLRDVEHDPPILGADRFRLRRPRGVTPEPLGQ